MRTNNLETNTEWFCGYCGSRLEMSKEQFLEHTNHCEIDNCNRKHGDLSGDIA